jgi:hypothetical protein
MLGYVDLMFKIAFYSNFPGFARLAMARTTAIPQGWGSCRETAGFLWMRGLPTDYCVLCD